MENQISGQFSVGKNESAVRPGKECMNSYLTMKWEVFKYNYSWPDYVHLFDGWLARCAMAAPFVGYLILFNDSISQHLSFDRLANEDSIGFGLSSTVRLQLIYLGLIALGLANIMYYVRRPYALKIGRDEFEYVEKGLEHFTVTSYIQMNGEIKHSGFDPYTPDGKYYDSEFKGFLRSSIAEHSDDGDKYH